MGRSRNVHQGNDEVRYTKQRDITSCGPVAIINYLKWMGYPISHNSIIDILKRHSNCCWDTGTKVNNLFRTIKELGIYLDFEVERIGPKREGINLLKGKNKKRLVTLSEGGCAFIFNNNYYNYADRMWNGHFFFVSDILYLPKYKNYYIKAINYIEKETDITLSIDSYAKTNLTVAIFVIKPK